MSKTLAIVGGGASGLLAAISAKQTNNALQVVVLEKNQRMLKKVLATGNGRCNFTNVHMHVSNFYGNDPTFASHALSQFTPQNAMDFFKQLGVYPKQEADGKVYPLSLQAGAVVDMLRFEAERLGIVFQTEWDVQQAFLTEQHPKKPLFCLQNQNKEKLFAHSLIMACGGCASPKLSENTHGYHIMEQWGHKSTKLSPVLVQLKTKKSPLHGLQGTKTDAQVAVYENGKCLGKATDELLFTEFGLSGPVVFFLSKFCHLRGELEFEIDFFPQFSAQELMEIFLQRKKQLSHLPVDNFLHGLLNKKIGQTLAKLSGIEKLTLPISQLTNKHLQQLQHTCKKTSTTVIGTNGFHFAQVTAGGLLTNGFNPCTMESKLVKNLYATGEILDIFGDCGGYNLHFAFASGHLAGRCAALAHI